MSKKVKKKKKFKCLKKSVNSTEKIKSIKKVTKIRAKIEKNIWKFLFYVNQTFHIPQAF